MMRIVRIKITTEENGEEKTIVDEKYNVNVKSIAAHLAARFETEREAKIREEIIQSEDPFYHAQSTL